jgi:NCAIR mutase (PurE)-related protein
MDNHPEKRDKTTDQSRINQEWLAHILEKVKSGNLSVTQAIQELSILPYEELDFAKIDHHRGIRIGFPEVILGTGKTTEQIVTIASHLSASTTKLLITHVDQETYVAVKAAIKDASYNPLAKAIVVNRQQNISLRPGITVVTGGTSDIPVAEEAAVTAEIMGNKVEKVFDVGVAGLHRLLDKLPKLRQAKVLVVVAGMEGALPSVVGGLVSAPIIAVPTSIGYGANFNGLAALLTMLNSCAPGIAVVNIDNGFGAGYMAGLINLGKSEKVDGEIKC